MRTRTSAALLLAVTFLLGGVAGAVSYYLYRGRSAAIGGRPERPDPKHIVDDMSRTLGLDAAQKEKLTVIISQSRERYRDLSKQFRPQYDAIRDKTNEEIRGILREDQQSRFVELLKDMESRRRARPAQPPAGFPPKSDRR
jgi:hypothetical protein